jgi:hypothetical protein
MTYYVERSGGLLELRQTRFREQRETRAGKGHPHDVCAVARDREEMERMAALLSGSVDWSTFDHQGGKLMLLGTIVDKDGMICLQTSPRVWYPLEGNSGIASDFQETFNRASRTDIGRQLHRVGGVLQMESLEQMRARLEGETV